MEHENAVAGHWNIGKTQSDLAWYAPFFAVHEKRHIVDFGIGRIMFLTTGHRVRTQRHTYPSHGASSRTHIYHSCNSATKASPRSDQFPGPFNTVWINRQRADRRRRIPNMLPAVYNRQYTNKSKGNIWISDCKQFRPDNDRKVVTFVQGFVQLWPSTIELTVLSDHHF